MKKLPQKTIDNLYEAIRKARGFGLCRYTDHGEPFCVIGQFAALQGFPMKHLQYKSACITFYSHRG